MTQETFRIYAVCYFQLSLALGSIAHRLKSYTICCLEISNGFVILSVEHQDLPSLLFYCRIEQETSHNGFEWKVTSCLYGVEVLLWLKAEKSIYWIWTFTYGGRNVCV